MASASEPQHPPLAHDVNGNRLPIPPGTCTWHICRHTEGRPKIIKGPDKEPARFPLDTTIEELADACGADIYRVYAADTVGKVIEHVTNVDVGRELRAATEPAVALVPAPRTAAPASDLRYALEAVTAIARTNAEAMRAVAEAQADWIKSISSARGFFRSAAMQQLPAPAVRNDNADDEDDDEGEAEDPVTAAVTGGMDWKAVIEPIVGIAVDKVVAVVMGSVHSKDGAGPKLPFDLRDALDWRRAADKAQAAKAVAEAATTTPPPGEPGRSQDPQAVEQALLSKAIAIGSVLAPADRSRFYRLAPRFSKHMSTPEVAELLGALVPMPTTDAAEWVRTHLDDLEKMFAA